MQTKTPLRLNDFMGTCTYAWLDFTRAGDLAPGVGVTLMPLARSVDSATTDSQEMTHEYFAMRMTLPTEDGAFYCD